MVETLTKEKINLKKMTDVAAEHKVKIKAVYDPENHEWTVKINEVVDTDNKSIVGIGDELETAMSDWIHEAAKQEQLRLRVKVEQYEKIELHHKN